MSTLDHARTSYERRAWGEAFEALTQAEGLGADDLERLAWSAALTGRDDAFLGALERLHKASIEEQAPKRAARAAFWIGFHMMSLGGTQANAWLARANKLLETVTEPCVERGYLLLPTIFSHLANADDAAAEKVAGEAAAIGERCCDRDLVALARNLEGRAVARQGRIEAGLALIDEVVLTVVSGELSPIVTGIVYCNVIVSCQQVYALDRARELTAALTRWCIEQPQLVTFTGHCLVHRAEIMQLGGAWEDAIAEVIQVCERTNKGDPDVFGDASYQHAELLRLRGNIAGAEKAYRVASESGRDPQPGLALLRLMQGQTEPAVNAIRRVLSTTTVKWQRARLLPASVEIMLAAGELDAARAASKELECLARDFGTEILGAIASHARGAVYVAEGDHRAAVEPLRHAFGVWQRVGAPYIAARIRVLIARAFLGLGDRDSAELERAAAKKVFEELGAADLTELEPSAATHGLSQRELEVLRLLASGKTNKAIARKLFVSERTVDRHVSNIFLKIDVSTRAAATAFAYENGLNERSG